MEKLHGVVCSNNLGQGPDVSKTFHQLILADKCSWTYLVLKWLAYSLTECGCARLGLTDECIAQW